MCTPRAPTNHPDPNPKTQDAEPEAWLTANLEHPTCAFTRACACACRYAAIFGELDTEERTGSSDGAAAATARAPSFGGADASWQEVELFYRHWEAFSTMRKCTFADTSDPSQSRRGSETNRQSRRTMEKENERCRAEGRRRRTDQVRALVAFAKRRDRRVAAREAEMAAAKLAKPSRGHAARLAALQLELEELEAEEAAEAAEEAEAEAKAEAKAAAEVKADPAEEEEEDDDDDVINHNQNSLVLSDYLSLREFVLAYAAKFVTSQTKKTSASNYMTTTATIKTSPPTLPALPTNISSLLRRLPLFSSIGGKTLVSLVDSITGLRNTSVFATPVNHQGDPSFGETSVWDAAMRGEFSKELLSYQTVEESSLLQFAAWPRPNSTENFLTKFCTVERLDAMSRDGLTAVLREFGRTKLWKSIGASKLMSSLRQARVVVVVVDLEDPEEGGRQQRIEASNVVDPEDTLFQELIAHQRQDNQQDQDHQAAEGEKKSEHGASHHPSLSTLPSLYAEDSLMLQALRKIGLASLKHFHCFYRAAAIVASACDEKKGGMLCDFLVNSFGSLNWFPTEWQKLAAIHFVPAFDVSSLMFPFGSKHVSPLRPPSKQNYLDLDLKIFGSKKISGGAYGSKGLGRDGRETFKSRQAVESLLADERAKTENKEYNQEEDQIGARNSLRDSIADSLVMMAEPSKRLKKQKKTTTTTTGTHTMVMTSLRNSALQLRVNAHMCWMEALILPPIFDRAHPSLLKVMNISHPPRCGVVLRHLKTVGERWENVSDLGTREDLKVCLQSVVLGCCAVVGSTP